MELPPKVGRPEPDPTKSHLTGQIPLLLTTIIYYSITRQLARKTIPLVLVVLHTRSHPRTGIQLHNYTSKHSQPHIIKYMSYISTTYNVIILYTKEAGYMLWVGALLCLYLATTIYINNKNPTAENDMMSQLGQSAGGGFQRRAELVLDSFNHSFY